MSHSSAHHLGIGPDELAGNGGRGRVLLLPGSIGRVRKIAAHFTDATVHANPRGLDVHIGQYTASGTTIDIGTLPTGMGCPSLGIVVSELIMIGARRMIRVGTAGTLQPDLPLGSIVIANGAVRDEATSDVFCPRDVPATAHPDWVDALREAASRLGHRDRSYVGSVHCKDAFYGREVPQGPFVAQHATYLTMLQQLGVLATEMESSHLFVLAALHGNNVAPLSRPSTNADAIKAGAVLAVIGGLDGFGPPELAKEAEQVAIEMALAAAVALIQTEDGGV
jgi:uridine phosphorylase